MLWGHIIGKYLSCLRKLDCVIIFTAGFEPQLRASPLSISFGMSALGMARQRRDGRLQGGIQPDHVSTLQGLDEVA
jgi:acetate kinase